MQQAITNNNINKTGPGKFIPHTIVDQCNELDILQIATDAGLVFKNGFAKAWTREEKTGSVRHWKEANLLIDFNGAIREKGFNVINFIESYLNKTFIEAVQYCEKYGVKYDANFDVEKYQQQEAAKKAAIDLQELQAEKCRKILYTGGGLAGYDYLDKDRAINDETKKVFGLGVDTYMKAITIPLHNVKGEIIGISKRFLQPTKSKYINPANSDYYNKSNYLYGLYQAIVSRAFNKTKQCVFVEGYFDLMQLVQAGITNVVSPCGTAISEDQIKLIKKYGVQKVVIFFDNDENKTGLNKTFEAIDKFLLQGISVFMITPPGSFKDADEWVRHLKNEGKTDIEIHDVIFHHENCKDAVHYKAQTIWRNANGQAKEKANAIKEIASLLFAIVDIDERTFYFDNICSQICKADKTIKLKQIQKSISTALDNIKPEINQDEKIDLSELSDQARQTYEENGFYALDKVEKGKPLVGFFSGPANNRTTLSNFTITAHFLIYNGIESRYLLSIYNGYRKSILDVPAKVITSIDQFQGYAVSEGNFLIFANKNQWLRIASDLLQQFPRCIEITRLGWQPFGFFAYLDKVYIPGEGLKDLDNMGMFTYKDENFLIPASCEAYKQLQRIGEDPFENDRCLTYKTTHISYSQWAAQMQKVYLDKGVVAIAFSILTIFRDLIFEVDGNCPHLFGFGEPSSGKSKMFESLTALFFFKRPAFNVNSGTDFAFFNYIGSFKNCFAHFNEVDVEVLKDEWFQAMKGWFDGEGRQRGKIGGGKNKTETMKPESTLGGTGQKIVVKDDNSFTQRSITLAYSITEKSEEQIKDYHILKQWEANGLNSLLTEILEHRSLFANKYKEQYKQQLGYWRKNKADVQQVNQRVLQNWCHLSACYNLISQHITLPQPAELFTEYCYQQAMHWSHFIHSSDTLSEFWKTITSLINEPFSKIIEGWNYTIETVLHVTIRDTRKTEKKIIFQEPTKILFLRLEDVHTQFEESFKRRKGKEAMSLDNLKHYFNSRKYNLGPVRQKWFKRIVILNENVNGSIETIKKPEKINSSCHAFLFDELDLNIEKFDGSESEAEILPPNNEIPFS